MGYLWHRASRPQAKVQDRGLSHKYFHNHTKKTAEKQPGP